MALNETQRRLRRSKDAERTIGHWLQEHDGIDEKWQGVASSASRVGHLTGLQFDVVSRHYAGESKNVKLPAKFLGWWIKIVGVATLQGKDALLYIQPSNVLTVQGVPKRPMSMHIITSDRHGELLRKERIADEYEASQH